MIYKVFCLVFAVDTVVTADLWYDFDAGSILFFEGSNFMINVTNTHLIGYITIIIRITLIGMDGLDREFVLVWHINYLLALHLVTTQ